MVRCGGIDNNEPEAPIFKEADYYIVGAAEEVVPQLAKALEVNNNANSK